MSLRDTINVMDRVITSFPSLDFSFKVYRGVNLNYFREYAVENLEDLKKLNNTFLFEDAFLSTSILKGNDFFGKKDDRGIDYNVRVIYNVDGRYSDGALLDSYFLSYSENQMEYLINKESLSFVRKVEIDHEKNEAFIYADLIPSKIWNKRKYNSKIKS